MTDSTRRAYSGLTAGRLITCRAFIRLARLDVPLAGAGEPRPAGYQGNSSERHHLIWLAPSDGGHKPQRPLGI